MLLFEISPEELDREIDDLWDEGRPGSCEPAVVLTVENGRIRAVFGEVYHFADEEWLRPRAAKHLRSLPEEEAVKVFLDNFELSKSYIEGETAVMYYRRQFAEAKLYGDDPSYDLVFTNHLNEFVEVVEEGGEDATFALEILKGIKEANLRGNVLSLGDGKELTEETINFMSNL